MSLCQWFSINEKLVMDSKLTDSNLRQLSECLRDASSLITTMLDSGDQHQPGTSSPQQVSQPQPVLQRERRATETCQGRRQAGREANVSATIASIVNRARLMIQESSSKGLYSRINKTA